ncbi:DNA-binding response regulator [Rhodohalobacter sp. SW132]|uniref:response regulator transcription factor n=1 Tax=Rhodohalobacter sp. SW132 TaxID=2293433 RepID=UPI000E252EA1|nr:DNA-binding response regulator [Rhodohalobacter sp. SW132]
MEAVEILTPREIKVLKMVERGNSNKEIAEEMHLSARTIQKHRNNICNKLDIRGRHGLIKWLWKVRNGDFK